MHEKTRYVYLSAELLGQPDDDAVGAADVAVPVDVLVLRHLAHEFGAVGAQAAEDVVDIVDDEREARDARGVHRRPRRTAGGHRSMERRQLNAAVAVRGPHDGDVRSDAVQPDELVHPFTLDCCLALQFQAQFDEERDSSREILDDNADLIHPVDRHAKQSRFAPLASKQPAGCLCCVNLDNIGVFTDYWALGFTIDGWP